MRLRLGSVRRSNPWAPSMIFASTFLGLLLGLALWAAAYLIADESAVPFLHALAPHLEAFSPGGWSLFVVLAAGIGRLAHRLLRARFGAR